MPPNPERDRPPIGRLQALDLWGGPITLERLGGGITNENYHVRAPAGSFVARLGLDLPWLGVDRRNEVACQRAAHALGVAPEVVYHENGLLVSAYLDARTMTPEAARDPAFLDRLAATLRALHDPWDELTGEFLYFSAFQASRTYAGTARSLGARLPDDLGPLLEGAKTLARRLAPFFPTLCHNDLLPANVLDDGRRVWLIDWEYAGVGHPLFDLAGVAANCGLSEPLEAGFLEAYRGRVADRELADLRALKALSLLREALWSAVQTVQSDLAFDYARYADDNFRLYREARARLPA